ncbi:hypothetical protein D3C76_1285580 [compost metagenome]
MLGLDSTRQLPEQGLPVRPFQTEQRLALPVLARRERAPLAIHQDLQATLGVEPKLAAKALAAGEGEQQPALRPLDQQQVVDAVIALVRRNAIDARIRAAPDRLGALPSAHGLGQHLEALTINGRLGGDAQLAVKQQPVLHGLRGGAGVIQPYPAQGAVPLAGLQQMGRQGGIGGPLAQHGQESGIRHGISS